MNVETISAKQFIEIVREMGAWDEQVNNAIVQDLNRITDDIVRADCMLIFYEGLKDLSREEKIAVVKNLKNRNKND